MVKNNREITTTKAKILDLNNVLVHPVNLVGYCELGKSYIDRVEDVNVIRRSKKKNVGPRVVEIKQVVLDKKKKRSFT